MPAGPASLIFAKITYMEDTRNVIDKFKGRSEAEIVKELDGKDHGLVIALSSVRINLTNSAVEPTYCTCKYLSVIIAPRLFHCRLPIT